MGYDFHITRAENWVENKGKEISLQEWLAYVASDPELREDSKNPHYYFVWNGGPDGADEWLRWSDGNISSKYPNRALVDKMIQIAGRFSAQVQGDDGEIYLNSSGIPESHEERVAQIDAAAPAESNRHTSRFLGLVKYELEDFFSNPIFKYFVVPLWLVSAAAILYIVLK